MLNHLSSTNWLQTAGLNQDAQTLLLNPRWWEDSVYNSLFTPNPYLFLTTRFHWLIQKSICSGFNSLLVVFLPDFFWNLAAFLASPMVKLGNEWIFKENTVRFPAHNRHSLSDLCGQLRGWGFPAQNLRILYIYSYVEERKTRVKNLNFYTKSAFSATTLKQALTHV